MRKVVVSVVISVLASACGGGEGEAQPTTSARASTTTIPESHAQVDPASAVAYWIDSLVLGRYDKAHLVIVPDQFLLSVSVEGFSTDLYDRFAAEGVPVDIRVNYWDSFVDGFEAVTGGRIDALAIGPAETMAAFGRTFASVELLGAEGDVAEMIAVYDAGADGWYVDLIASFGPTFAPLFSTWHDQLPIETPARRQMREQLPSWQLAAFRLPAWDTESRDLIATVVERLTA